MDNVFQPKSFLVIYESKLISNNFEIENASHNLCLFGFHFIPFENQYGVSCAVSWMRCYIIAYINQTLSCPWKVAINAKWETREDLVDIEMLSDVENVIVLIVLFFLTQWCIQKLLAINLFPFSRKIYWDQFILPILFFLLRTLKYHHL